LRSLILRALFWGAAGVLITLSTGTTFRTMGWSAPVLVAALIGLLSAIGSWCSIDGIGHQLGKRGPDRHWPILTVVAVMAVAALVWDVYALTATGKLLGWPTWAILGVFGVGVALLAAQGATRSGSGTSGEGGGLQ